jgi:hypothetical protein
MKHIEKAKSSRSFLYRYHGSIKYDKRMYVHNKPSLVSNTYNPYEDYLSTHSTTKIDSVEAVEITMPIVEFEKLVDEHEELESLKNFTGLPSVDMIKHDYGQMREQYLAKLNEMRIRNSNESVRKAYENYQLLLKLCG